MLEYFAPPPEEGHDLDDEGSHDPDGCELCLERNHSVNCTCRCGNCCESLLIEVTLRDAEREPKIKERGSELCEGIDGHQQHIGYLLNGEHGHCVFFDIGSRLCTIHDTRPLVCRLFNCDQKKSDRE